MTKTPPQASTEHSGKNPVERLTALYSTLDSVDRFREILLCLLIFVIDAISFSIYFSMITTMSTVAYNQFAIHGRPVTPKLPAVELTTLALQYESVRKVRLAVKTSASSSFVGSGAEYSAYNRFAIHGRPVTPKLPAVELTTLALQYESVRKVRLAVKTSTSSSFVGSGAEYSAYNRFAIHGRPVTPKSPAVELKTSALQCEPVRKVRLSVKTSASSSFVGSGAEYSEPLPTAQKKKGRKIAGIDQDELVDPKLLADADSCFCEFQGLELHHKICDPVSGLQDSLPDATVSDSSHKTRNLKYPLILLHGFGASLFSWNAVMKRLANVSGSKVLSFDRPAFGLTSRVDNPLKHAPPGGIQDTKPLNPYSMAFAVLATLYFIDFLAAEKAILVGHSAGCIVAAQTYFQAPKRVAALILVAPAIVAPFTSPKKVKPNSQQDGSKSDDIKNPFSSLLSIVSNFSRFIAQTILSFFKGMANMVNSLYKKALSAFLRSSLAVMLIRMVIGRFGVSAIKNAWYEASKVDDSVVEAYTRPLRAKGWDKALAEFTAEMVTGSWPESNPPLPERLKDISCPVLIVTGDSDRLVPSWNVVRLSQAIPGSHLEVITKCGHLPHEEKPHEFLTVVDNFLARAFPGVESQPLQPAT